MNPVERRKLDLWCQDMMSRPRWTYCEAVLWVAFRDLYALRRELTALEEINYKHGALGVAEIVEAQVSDEQSPNHPIELLPHTSLIVALKAGDVTAWGRTRKHSGYSAAYLGDPEPMAPAIWHEFTPVRSISPYPDKISPVLAGLELVPLHWRRTPGHVHETPTKYWSGVEIAASTLRSAFPSVASASSRGRPASPWHRVEDDAPSRWVLRREVVAEGCRRWSSRRLGELHQHLADMWNEVDDGNTREPATFEKLLQSEDVRDAYKEGRGW